MASQSPKLTEKLVSSYPWMRTSFIVGAPMRLIAGPELAVAISSAGGLGFIGPGNDTRHTAKIISRAKELIPARLSMSGNLKTSAEPPLPVGVGFQTWNDDLETAVSLIRTYRPCAAWLFAPRHGQEEFNLWTKRIRDCSPDTCVWIQVGTLREALQATQSPTPPDVLVIQGADAGGHGRAIDGIGLVTLLPEIADATQDSNIPLIAAGGIADGRGVAAAICLGASGVAMGTRFLAATEAQISKGYQNEVVRAKDGVASTQRTTLYNQLRGTIGWPEEFSPRTIVNRSWYEHKAGRPFSELKRLHDLASEAGDAGWGPEGRLATYAGAGVGLVRDVRDAQEIVIGTQDEAKRLIKSLQ
ncbi:putative oxidoreductase 2-nitropropane dioxygenase family [Bisporella sp. PMI_857]|nr:putative oxidoreductase 2-nitropropane dioxygenase family [Bisporella sp. PMI_857]